MYNTGCRELWIGMENASCKLLKEMNKCNNAKQYIETVEGLLKNCHEIGIGLHFCLLFGFPTENDRNINLEFFNKNRKYFNKIPFFATFNIFNLNYGSDVFKNPEKYGVKSIEYNEENFNMINIPFKSLHGNDIYNPQYVNNVDNIAEKLTAIFVKSDTKKLLWFMMSDSPWELLYKAHYGAIGTNPFQHGGSLLEKIFLKIYFLFEKQALFMKLINTITNKKIVSSKTQVYR